MQIFTPASARIACDNIHTATYSGNEVDRKVNIDRDGVGCIAHRDIAADVYILNVDI